MAGIPITARGYASSFSVVSAHLRGNRVNLDWVDLLLKENHSVVVLMGLSRVNEIVERAKNIGVKENILVSIISNASRENQSVVTTTLKKLVEQSHGIERPAVLVFGDVNRFIT